MGNDDDDEVTPQQIPEEVKDEGAWGDGQEEVAEEVSWGGDDDGR